MNSQTFKRLKVSKFSPSKELEHLVQYMFVIENEQGGQHNMKVPASLYFDLIVPVKGYIRVEPEPEPVMNAFVSPILCSFKTVTFYPDTVLFGIRIRPEVFLDLTKQSPSLLLQRPNPADRYFSSFLLRSIQYFFERVGFFSDQVIQDIQSLIGSNWIVELPHKDETQRILTFARQAEVKSVSELAKRLNCSIRWLQLKTKHNLGISPHKILEVHRIKQFLETPHCNQTKNWATKTGLELGFYDQPHFNRFVQKISGESPLRLLKSELTLLEEFRD